MFDIQIENPKNIEMYQYDRGNKITFDKEIEGLTQIHYECEGETDTQLIEDNQALVPYSMTKIGKSIQCYFYVITSTGERTKFNFTIIIKARPKPNSEISVEEEKTFLIEAKEIINATKEIAQSVNEKIQTNEQILEQMADIKKQAVESVKQTKDDGINALISTKDDYLKIFDNRKLIIITDLDNQKAMILTDISNMGTVAMNNIANREGVAIGNIADLESLVQRNINTNANQHLKNINDEATRHMNTLELQANKIFERIGYFTLELSTQALSEVIDVTDYNLILLDSLVVNNSSAEVGENLYLEIRKYKDEVETIEYIRELNGRLNISDCDAIRLIVRYRGGPGYESTVNYTLARYDVEHIGDAIKSNTESIVELTQNKADKNEWELIRSITVEEELGVVEITKNEEGNTFAYDDIIVVANGVKGTSGGNWWVSIKTTENQSNSGLIQIGNANPLSSSTAKGFQTKIERMFGLNRYEYESSYKNANTYVSTINKGTVSTAFELGESTKINYVRIHFSTNNVINAGTIMVYGRKRR